MALENATFLNLFLRYQYEKNCDQTRLRTTMAAYWIASNYLLRDYDQLVTWTYFVTCLR